MLHRILIFLLLCVAVSDAYIYLCYIRRFTASTLKRALYFLPSLLLLIALFVLNHYDHFTARENHIIGLYLIIYMLLVVPKCLFVIFSSLGKLIGLCWKRGPLVGNALGLLAGVAVFCSIFYGTVWGWRQYQVKEVTFTSPDLPQAFDGYRIVQFSDLHIGTIAGYPRQVQRIVDLINSQKADLIVFTGDLVNHRANELDGVEPILSQLHAPDGVFSVLGNHDFSPYLHWKTPQAKAANLKDLEDREARMGWKLLNNSHVLLHRADTCIALVGVENQGLPPFPQMGDLPKAMKGTEGLYKVLLSHDPTHWDREVLPDSDIQLMLAGHTHAMQVELFGFTPASWFFKESHGMYLHQGRGLYVNAGVGEVMLPFRFGAWPEVTVITLRK